MRRCLKEELGRAFWNPGLFAALAVGLALAVWHYFQNVLPMTQYLDNYLIQFDYPHSVFNKWIGGESYSLQSFLYFLLLPVLAVLPFGVSYQRDAKCGAVKNFLIRCKRSCYYLSKYIAAFLSGGVTIVLPLLINLGLTASTLPALIPMSMTGTFPIFSNAMWSGIYYTYPWLYVALYLAVIFIFGGLFACVALAFSDFLKNGFVVMISPFLVHLFIYTLCNTLRLPALSPFNFLSPAQPSGAASFTAICVEGLLAFAVTFGVFLYKGMRDDVY